MFIDYSGLSAGFLRAQIFYNQKSSQRNKFLVSIFLFVIIFLILGTAVDEIWFREDDLGTILNGLVSSWQNFIKVFSTDVRDFICPVNYHRSAPNIISGFLRPLQHFLFTIEWALFGDYAYPYFLVHVGLHALNALLLYVISLLFLPVWCAFFAGLFFALYPDVSWLSWIATAQNTLCTLFLLLTFICWKRRWLAGLMFFLSLLARENVVAVPLWLFCGGWLFLTNTSQTFSQRVKVVWNASWIFFVADAIYWLIRWWAFGFGTLSRTLSNVLLRFPFLASLVQASDQKIMNAAYPASNVVIHHGTRGAVVPLSYISQLEQMFTRVMKFFTSWLSSVLMVDLVAPQAQFFAIIFFFVAMTFLIFAYRHHLKNLYFLLLGILFMSWPALVAYSCPRYLNTLYPVIALLLSGGCFLALKQEKKWLQIGAWCMLLIMSFAIIRGTFYNRKLLYEGAAARAEYKKRFDLFFANNKFELGTQFIVFNSPFVSDIQSIFQTYLHDFSVQVAYEPFATLAEQGIFGCNKPYRTTNVASRLEPIEGGFRFISDDPEHCSWWIHFSDHPLAWSEKDWAYIWTNKPYREGFWYSCSLGKFRINHMIDGKYLIDVSLVFDECWLDHQTIFVVWNSLHGQYEQLNKKHLFK